MSFDTTIAALGNPVRRQILRVLRGSPRRAGDLASAFAISRPAICKHAQLLTRAGLVRARRNGRERVYDLAPSGGRVMRQTIGELEELERYWNAVMEAFRRYAERKE